MDAFKLLKADHKKVAALFDRLEVASGKAKLVYLGKSEASLNFTLTLS